MPRHHHPSGCHLLLLRTIVHTAAVIVVVHEDKEQPTMPRYCCPHSCHCCHCAPLFAPLLLLPSHKKAWSSQQCHHGTVFHSAAILLCCRHRCHHARGNEQPMMPRHCHLLCHHLSMLPPLLLLRERARDSQQWC
jgi:hypothetical protein